MGGAVALWLVRSSPERVVRVRALAEDIPFAFSFFFKISSSVGITRFYLKSLFGRGLLIALLFASRYMMNIFGLLGSYSGTSGLFAFAYLLLTMEIPPLIPLSTKRCISMSDVCISMSDSSSTPVFFKSVFQETPGDVK